ncbi:MAG: DUF6915 family protein [Candidatus Thorarchaeota archaeon]
MAKPYIHSLNSVKKWGGVPEDYLPIHDMMDSSKAHIADMRHRMVFHSSFGIFIMEEMFGTFIVNSDDKKVQVRDIAEQHVLEDLGYIPTLQDYVAKLPIEPWMTGVRRSKKPMVIVD